MMMITVNKSDDNNDDDHDDDSYDDDSLLQLRSQPYSSRHRSSTPLLAQGGGCLQNHPMSCDDDDDGDDDGDDDEDDDGDGDEYEDEDDDGVHTHLRGINFHNDLFLSVELTTLMTSLSSTT